MYLMKYIKLPKLRNYKNFEETGNFNPIFYEDKEIFNRKKKQIKIQNMYNKFKININK